MSNFVIGILVCGNLAWISKRTNTKTYSGYWQFVAGQVETGENIYPNAIIRTIKEKTALVVDSEQIEYIGSNIRKNDTYFVYKVSLKDSEIPDNTQPSLMTKWQSIALVELTKSKLIPGLTQLISRTILKNVSN